MYNSQVVEEIEDRQRKYLYRRGSRFVFLSDELYHLAGRPYPEAAEYEGFPQLENGVGMARLFLDELKELADQLPAALTKPCKITLVTGVEATHLLEQLMGKLARIKLLEANLLPLKNRFFGPSVTVAGLLTGEDLQRELREISPGETVFIPETMLKEGEGLFLDGQTREHLEESMGVSLIPVKGPLDFARELRKLVRVMPEKSGSGCPEGGR